MIRCPVTTSPILFHLSLAIVATVALLGQRSTALAQTTTSKPPGALGLSVQVMPVGKLSMYAQPRGQTFDPSFDTSVATAVSPFIDFALRPGLSVGFSPQVIFNVKGKNDTESATQYDLRLRLTGEFLVAPLVSVFGRLSPGYSIIDLPASVSRDATAQGVSLSSPKGFLIGVSTGAVVAVATNAFLTIDLGYQWGFQTAVASGNGMTLDFELHSRYLHVGAGFGVRFGA